MGRRHLPRLRWMLHDPPDLVGRPPARFEIDARLHLGDDPEQQEENPTGRLSPRATVVVSVSRRGRRRIWDKRPAEPGQREHEKPEAELSEELHRPV